MQKYFLISLLVLGFGALVALSPQIMALVRGRDNDTPPWIESAALAGTVKAVTDYVIVDVRSPEEFNGPLGHIKGARNLPVENLLVEPGTLAQFRAVCDHIEAYPAWRI